MGAQHTPGPLEVIGNLVRTSMVQDGDRPRGILIAECLDGFGQPHSDEAKANARLFAASHDLLAVARMATMLRQLGGMLPGSREIVQALVEAADAAIAKAGGAS
jgi:hypothetical protein